MVWALSPVRSIRILPSLSTVTSTAAARSSLVRSLPEVDSLEESAIGTVEMRHLEPAHQAEREHIKTKTAGSDITDL